LPEATTCPFNNINQIFPCFALTLRPRSPSPCDPFNFRFSDLQERMGPKLWAGTAGLLPRQEEGRGGQCHESSQQDCRRIYCQGQVSDHALNNHALNNQGQVSDHSLNNQGQVRNHALNNQGQVSDHALNNRGQVSDRALNNHGSVIMH
jgi:hypothetical protein